MDCLVHDVTSLLAETYRKIQMEAGELCSLV